MRTFFFITLISGVLLTLGVAAAFYFLRPMPNPYSDEMLSNELLNKQLEIVYYDAHLRLIEPQIEGIAKILELTREQLNDLREMVETAALAPSTDRLAELAKQIVEDGKRLEELYETRTIYADYLKTLRKYIFTVCIKLRLPPDSAEKAMKGELGETELREMLARRGPIEE